MLTEFKGAGLLIHHWDTDGICSAALILDKLKGKNIETWTPTLGAFYLDSQQISTAQGFDYVIIADMALPEKDVSEIAQKTKVIILDHHHQSLIPGTEHINPVSQSKSSDDYPSATWVVKEYLDLPLSLYVILGIVGDREHKIKDNIPFWKLLEAYMKEHHITFEELLQLVYIIDANYKVGDKESVEGAPYQLMEYNGPFDILGNQIWAKNLRLLDEKLDSVLAVPPEDRDGVLVKHLDTKYAIISQVTRRIAWGTGKNTLVLNTGFFHDEDQLYVRSSTLSMLPMITRAKELGFNSGGKKDVLGALIPKHMTEIFIEEIHRFFKDNS